MDVKRRLVINTATAYAATAISYVVGLVAAPYFIHNLGSSAYGVATLIDVFTITGWVSLLELGIQSSATKFTAERAAREDWEHVSRIVSTAFALFMLGGGVLAIGIIAAAGWLVDSAFNIPSQHEHALFVTFEVLALALAIQFPGLAVAAAVEGTQRSDLVVIVRVLTTVAGTGIAVVLIGSGQGLLAYMLVITLAPAAGVLILTAWLLRARRQVHIRPRFVSRSTLKGMLPLAGQTVVARMAVLAMLNTDKIVIGAILATTALTQYSIAAKIYSVVYVIGALMNSAVLAAASHYDALRARDELRQLFLRGTKYAVAISMPLAAAIMVLAPDLCEAWIGSEFRSSGATTQIWLASIFVPVFTGVASIILMGMNRMRPTVPMWMGAAALNLGITIPGALLWGVNGVVLGTSVAYLALAPPFLAYILRTLDVSLRVFFAEAVRPTLAWIVVAALVAVGALAVLSNPSLVDLLLVLVIAEGLAVGGFVMISVSRSERASLLRRSSLTAEAG